MKPNTTDALLLRVVIRSDGCWGFVGKHDREGYTERVPIRGQRHRPHRLVYESLVGAVPAGLVLDHLCRNRWCVNPRHLQPVTHRENIMRGEGLAPQNAAKTRCVNGHPFTEANTWRCATSGRRQCRACLDARTRRYRAARAAA